MPSPIALVHPPAVTGVDRTECYPDFFYIAGGKKVFLAEGKM